MKKMIIIYWRSLNPFSFHEYLFLITRIRFCRWFSNESLCFIIQTKIVPFPHQKECNFVFIIYIYHEYSIFSNHIQKENKESFIINNLIFSLHIILFYFLYHPISIQLIIFDLYSSFVLFLSHDIDQWSFSTVIHGFSIHRFL